MYSQCRSRTYCQHTLSPFRIPASDNLHISIHLQTGLKKIGFGTGMVFKKVAPPINIFKQIRQQPTCTYPMCTKPRVKSTDGTGDSSKCSDHGGSNRCQHPMLDDKVCGRVSYRRLPRTKCKRHLKTCLHLGCENNQIEVSTLCKRHMAGTTLCSYRKNGVRTCYKDVAPHHPTGIENMCVTHGGGERCQHVQDDGTMCKAPASHSTDNTGLQQRCVEHFGGNRCQKRTSQLDNRTCYAPSVNQTNRCTTHRHTCSIPACTKQRRDGRDTCDRHKEGMCLYMEGTKSCGNRVAQGSLTMCSKHDGGPRCVMSGCSKPALTESLCSTHTRNMVT